MTQPGLGRTVLELATDDTQLNRGLERAEARVKGFKGSVAQSRAEVRGLGTDAGQVGKMLAVGLSAPMIAAAGASLKFAMDFNRSMANVASLIPGNSKRVDELKKSVQDMAIATGKSTQDLSGGLYQVISAFGDTSDTAKILEINAKAAAAGVAETTDAINLTSAVTKGYGDTSADAVQKVSDLALLTVRLGQTTFPELASSIGRVTPLAAELNVKQEELFATMATFTGVTGGAAEVSTQLRGVLQSLLSPTDTMKKLLKELGVESGKALIEQRGLKGAIDAVVSASKNGGVDLQKLIGSIEGQALALSAAGAQSDSYTQKLDEMGRAAGATDAAFKEQTDGVNKAGFEWDQFKRRMETTAQQLGDRLLPMLSDVGHNVLDVAEAIDDGIRAFNELPQPVRDAAIAVGELSAAFWLLSAALTAINGSAVARILGPVVTHLGEIRRLVQWGGWGGLSLVFQNWGAAITTGLLGPLTLVIGALSTLRAMSGSWTGAAQDVFDLMRGSIPLNAYLNAGKWGGTKAPTGRDINLPNEYGQALDPFGPTAVRNSAFSSQSEWWRRAAGMREKGAEPGTGGPGPTPPSAPGSPKPALPPLPRTSLFNYATDWYVDKWFQPAVPARNGLEPILPSRNIGLPMGFEPSAGTPSGPPKTGPGMFAGFGDQLSATILSSLTGGGNPFKAAGGLLGSTVGTGLVSKFGDTIKGALGKVFGGALNSMLPGVGGMLGSALGKLASKVGGWLGIGKSKGKLEGEKADEGIAALKRELEGMGWTLEDLRTKGGAAGKALADSWGDKNVAGLAHFQGLFDKFKESLNLQEEIDALNGQLESLKASQVPTWDEIKAAADRYGISLDALGPKIKQLEMNEVSKNLLDDYNILIAGGADANAVLDGMSDEISKIVTDSIKFGTEIPENMRPLIETLAKTGRLFDENGNKIEDISTLKFGEPVVTEADKINKAISDLVAKIQALIDKLNGVPSAAAGIPDNIDTQVTYHRRYVDGPSEGGGETPTPEYHRGGLVGARLARVAHDGMFVGLDVDEVPIIAQRGEGILSRRGMSAMAEWALNSLNAGRGPGGETSAAPAVGNVHVELKVDAIDQHGVKKFMEEQGIPAIVEAVRYNARGARESMRSVVKPLVAAEGIA